MMNEYADTVERFEAPLDVFETAVQYSQHVRLLHAAVGCCTESAEFLDALKRTLFYGTPLDTVNIFEELGDILFYVTLACNVLDVSMEQVLDANRLKLQRRFGDKFDTQAAIKRDVAAERAVLSTKLGNGE